MKKFLRNFLFGDASIREYSTITLRHEIHERVLLYTDSTEVDISVNHWLLCLDPIVFGIWLEKKGEVCRINKEVLYHMQFMDSAVGADVVADLTLNYLDEIDEQVGTLLLLKLKKVGIHHLSFFKSRLLYYRYYKKPEQDFYKLKSYSAAYSYPRRVRLVSFREGTWYNIFPMDLVGDIPHCGRYVFGLRHSNVTLKRILETGKIVVSEVPYKFKDAIYQLGKHHRNALSDAELPFGVILSETFGYPVPEWANSYKEIRIIRNINLGSHMLLWGEEINQKYVSESNGHLFHIHFLHYLHQKRKGLIYQLV